jgi:hypothetical protein
MNIAAPPDEGILRELQRAGGGARQWSIRVVIHEGRDVVTILQHAINCRVSDRLVEAS